MRLGACVTRDDRSALQDIRRQESEVHDDTHLTRATGPQSPKDLRDDHSEAPGELKKVGLLLH